MNVTGTKEIELKAVVPNPAALERRLIAAGGRVKFRGSLIDRRYDTPNGKLRAKDHVLRLRVHHPAGGEPVAALEWKGPTEYTDGFKVREERAVSVQDSDAAHALLTALGYVIVREIDREIVVFDFGDAVARSERYPRMDVLLEVEGTPDSIERVIAATGIPREEFTTDRLADFVKAYRRRTGKRAAVSEREKRGEYIYSETDA